MFNTFSLENQTNLVNVWSRLQIMDLTFSNLDQLLTLFQVKGLSIQLLYGRLKNSFYTIRANRFTENKTISKKKKNHFVLNPKALGTRREKILPNWDILSLAASRSLTKFWLEPICWTSEEKTTSGEIMKNRAAKCIPILCSPEFRRPRRRNLKTTISSLLFFFSEISSQSFLLWVES